MPDQDNGNTRSNSANTADSTSQGNNQQRGGYYDFHASGLAYLNRVRTVPVRRGSDFIAATLAVLYGSVDFVEKTYIDTRVVGRKAIATIEALQASDEVNMDSDAILVGFVVGDMYPDTYEKRNEDGSKVVMPTTKGRLLEIKWVKVNGKNFDLPEQDASQATGTGSTQDASQATGTEG